MAEDPITSRTPRCRRSAANTVFGVIRVSIFFAAADAAGGSIAGYDRTALSTYTWSGRG